MDDFLRERLGMKCRGRNAYKHTTLLGQGISEEVRYPSKRINCCILAERFLAKAAAVIKYVPYIFIVTE